MDGTHGTAISHDIGDQCAVGGAVAFCPFAQPECSGETFQAHHFILPNAGCIGGDKLDSHLRAPSRGSVETLPFISRASKLRRAASRRHPGRGAQQA